MHAHYWRLFFLIGSTFLFSACTAINSEDYGKGTHYYLPKGLVDIEILQRKDNQEFFAITIHGAIYKADEGFDYVTRYYSNPFSHDTISVGLEVDDDTKRPNGFISSIDFVGDDKSDEFIIKLVELAKKAVKITTFTPEGKGHLDDPADFTTVYRGTFDPLSSNDRFRMNVLFDRITNNAFNITIPSRIKHLYQDKVAPRSDCNGSICFRKPLSIPLIFKLENGIEFRRVHIVLPDRSSIGSVDIKRAAFVRKVTNVRFASGMLQSVHIDKPSEALAAIEIPLAIADAILAVPGEILKLKIDTTTQNRQLHEARLNELKAREALVEFQKEQAEKARDVNDDDNDQPDS